MRLYQYRAAPTLPADFQFSLPQQCNWIECSCEQTTLAPEISSNTIDEAGDGWLTGRVDDSREHNLIFMEMLVPARPPDRKTSGRQIETNGDFLRKIGNSQESGAVGAADWLPTDAPYESKPSTKNNISRCFATGSR